MNRHIRRLKRGAALATTVAIGLTPALVAAPSANAAAPVPVTRIAGANRFGTAAAIAEKAFPAGASTVIVATGFNFPDALAGNYLAGVDKAPILLVNVDNVPSETSAALQTLKAKNVIILGQTNAVDTNTENQLKSAGYTTSRIGGATRLETMQMIDEAPNATTIGMVNGKKTALLARADNFPDALGGGPVAFAKNFPVILTATDALSPQAQDVITKDGIQQVIILGGPVAISPATESQANAAGAATLYRANGVDRSDTSRLLGEYALANLGFVNTSYGIASGDQYFTGADALASGPFSGGIPQPTLVTNSVNDPGKLVQWGQAHNATATTCYAFGGPIPLPDSTVNAVCNATPASNQTFTVTPTGSGNTPINNVVNETVTGLGTAPVDIQLFNCANVTSSSTGPASFKGTNPGGTGNFAIQGTNQGSILTVNGSPQTNGVGGAAQGSGNTATPGNQVNGVTPSSGSVSFSFTDATPECVVPVVFQQGSGATANQLPLGTSNTPSVPFGLGRATTFTPTAATAGSFGGGGGTVAPSPATTQVGPNFFVEGSKTYTFGSGDQYQLYNSTAASCQTDTFADFQQRLTQGDAVGGNYQPNGTSTFCLNDVAPAPPSNVMSTTNPGTGVTVSWTNATVNEGNSNITQYTIYRAPGTPPAITGAPYTCPAAYSNAPGTSPQNTPSSAYSVIATVPAAPTASQQSATYTYNGAAVPPAYTYQDTTAAAGSGTTANTYCYAVSSVSPNAAGSTQTGTAQPASNGGTAPNPATPTAASGANPAPTSGSNATTTGAPKFASAANAHTTTVTVTYNQPISCASVDLDASDFGVTYSHNGVTFTDNPTGFSSCGNTGTGGVGVVALTVPTAPAAGDIVIVTAKAGTDGNTVASNTTPAQFQPAGDAVQTTAV